LYCEKQKLNEPLYKFHCECAKYSIVTWQYIQTATNAQLDKMMDSIFQTLNNKIDALQKYKPQIDNNKNTTKHAFHARLVNLTRVKFSDDQINTLNLGLDYAIEKNQKEFIKTLIIDTENAIRHLDIRIQNIFIYLTTSYTRQVAKTLLFE
jgi:hypothetical protein